MYIHRAQIEKERCNLVAVTKLAQVLRCSGAQVLRCSGERHAFCMALPVSINETVVLRAENVVLGDLQIFEC